MNRRQLQRKIPDSDVPDAAMDESPDAAPLIFPDAAPFAVTTPSASVPQTLPSIFSPSSLAPRNKNLSALKSIIPRKRGHSDAFSSQSQTPAASSSTSADSVQALEHTIKKQRATETATDQAAKTDKDPKETASQVLASSSSSTSQTAFSNSHASSPAASGAGSAAIELKLERKAPRGLTKRSGKNTEIFDRVVVINLSPSWQADLERDLKEITERCNLLLTINGGSQSSTASVGLEAILKGGCLSSLYKTISAGLGSIFDFSSAGPITKSPVKALYLNNFSAKELDCLPDVIHDLAQVSFFQNPYYIDFTADDAFKGELKRKIGKKCRSDERECILAYRRQDFIKKKFDQQIVQSGMGLAPMELTNLDSSSSLNVTAPRLGSTGASERGSLFSPAFAHSHILLNKTGSQAEAAATETKSKDKMKDKEKKNEKPKESAKLPAFDLSSAIKKDYRTLTVLYKSTPEELRSLAQASIKWLTLTPKTETSEELGVFIFVYNQYRKTKLTNLTNWILKDFVKSSGSDKEHKQNEINGVGFSYATPYKPNKNLKIACLQSTDENGKLVGYCDAIHGPIWKQIISNMSYGNTVDEFKKQKIGPGHKDWETFRRIFLEKNVQHHFRLSQSLKAKGYSRHEKDKWEFLGVTEEGQIQIRDKDGEEKFLPDRIAMLSATEILKYKPSHAASSSSDSERKSRRSLRDSDAPAPSVYGSGSGSGSSFTFSSSHFFGSSSSQPAQQLSMARENEESARRKP